jgi:hypothetical protein
MGLTLRLALAHSLVHKKCEETDGAVEKDLQETLP